VLYVTRIGEVVFVLHAFQKKTQKTAKRDLDLAASRLAQLWEDTDETPEF
jgi:phage-related protein